MNSADWRPWLITFKGRPKTKLPARKLLKEEDKRLFISESSSRETWWVISILTPPGTMGEQNSIVTRRCTRERLAVRQTEELRVTQSAGFLAARGLRTVGGSNLRATIPIR